MEKSNKRIQELQRQLAEATKPVGDDEIEKAIKHINYALHTTTFQTMIGANGVNYLHLLFRAARQRKPSGDAVELAKWLKQESHGCSCGDCTKAAKLCDSILAQSAAGDSVAREFLTASTEGVDRVPAADLLTAEERKDAEEFAHGDFAYSLEVRRVSRALLRLAPAPSSATLTGEKS